MVDLQCMTDHHDDAPDGARPGPHRWRKGGPSPNPKGRPRVGLALADAIRRRMSPDTLIDLALRLAGDETVSVADRVAALLPLYDRGYVRPPTATLLRLETEEVAPARDYSRLTLDQRRTLLALHRAAALPAGATNGDGAAEALVVVGTSAPLDRDPT